MANSFITLTTPITDTSLQLISLQGNEAISRPFDYTVALRSTVADVDFTAVLGQPIVIKMTASDASEQYINGVAVEFAQDQNDSRSTVYTARLRPSFWLLSMKSDYAIYQTKTVIEIITAAFSAASFTDFRNDTTQTYTARDYVVQYGETTFDFVSRLMQEAGIFYYFEHTASASTLVLADDASSYGTLPGAGTIPYGGQPGSQDGQVLIDGALQQRLVPTSYKVNDYNFTAPATALLSTSSGATTYQLSEYPGKYLVKADGDTLAGLRLSALETSASTFSGNSLSSNFHAGYKFTLSGHPRAAANAEWAILSVSINIGEDGQYSNRFSAFPATVTYRPVRSTPRPSIHGTQTARVTGKAGEEIWTDSYGRIKVKFHWDTSSASDETTSCWVRVAQTWAGKAYGSVSIPRIGAEVVVAFLDGDPDQPIVVGTVYNATQTLPYTLPADQTKTTFKTYTSKGGAGFNELRFEDKAENEEIFLQAQKDLNVKVVKGNYGVTVVEGNETHSTKGTRGFTVEGAETHTNKADFTQDITGKTTITATGDEKHTNSANFEQDVTGNYTLKVTGNLVIKATGSVAIESGTGFTAKAGTSMAVSSGTSCGVKGGTQLALEGGVTAELKGAAQTAIKGGIVQIN